MKRYIIYITLMAAAVASCNVPEMETAMTENEGKAQVHFRLPSYCSAYSMEDARVVTKADVLPEDERRDLPTALESHYLEDGSTLWLTWSQKNADGTFSLPELRAYQVRSAGDWSALYPCMHKDVDSTDIDGNPCTYKVCIPDKTAAPLYLEEGTYKFKMISPAYPLIETVTEDSWNWKLHVDNGMYFCSTDGRYNDTMPTETVVEIDPNGDNIQYVTLKPMIHQTARLRFSIVRGNYVDSLKILPAGVEVSGLQNPTNSLPFDWSSEDIADTLVMKRGDKRQWLKIADSTFTVSHEPLTWDADRDGIAETYTERLIGDAGVLPTNAMSTTIIITFNLLVNGIPTQYVTTMNQIILEHAHEYHLRLKVDRHEGITVFTWQYQSWTHDIELEPVS